MGNRSFVELSNSEGPYTWVAESNNNLPAAWFSLITRSDLTSYLAEFQSWEADLPPTSADEDQWDADFDIPAPPALRLPSAQALATGQQWLNRPGVSDLLSTIEEFRDAPDDAIEIDWSQYRSFYSTHDEFRTSLLAAFDEFANGTDAERPFDQVGELHTRRPEPMPKAEVDGVQPKPARVTHPSILDREWATWLLGILAAAAGLGTWLLTKSVVAGVGAFLLVAVSSTLAVLALERLWWHLRA